MIVMDNRVPTFESAATALRRSQFTNPRDPSAVDWARGSGMEGARAGARGVRRDRDANIAALGE